MKIARNVYNHEKLKLQNFTLPTMLNAETRFCRTNFSKV